MQLSLVDEVPEFSKTFFLDVYAEAQFDIKTEKMKLKTIVGQQVPVDLKVAIASKFIAYYPEGTIYKIDTRLIIKKGKRPYFVALKSKRVQRAVEYFDYNLKVQYGFDFKFDQRAQA
jgi:hypothetical protein